MRKPTVLCCGQVPHFNERIGELEHVAFLEEIDMPPARLKKYNVFRAFKYAGAVLFCLLYPQYLQELLCQHRSGSCTDPELRSR